MEFDIMLPDLLKKAKRGPAVVLPKDFGAIAANTGLGNGWKVVDAGTGSGWLAMQIANIIGKEGKVYTYEIRKEFAKLAKENFAKFKNVQLKQKDIYRGIAEKNLDLITIDLQEPWKVVKHAEKSLKAGGFFVAYCPQITQVIQLAKEIKKTKLKLVHVSETIERPWIIDGRIARPEHNILVHTAFLVFARKFD
jgi:tRNA (adenine57-N1/adenine58-N1)-methyltransferase